MSKQDFIIQEISRLEFVYRRIRTCATNEIYFDILHRLLEEQYAWCKGNLYSDINTPFHDALTETIEQQCAHYLLMKQTGAATSTSAEYSGLIFHFELDVLDQISLLKRSVERYGEY